MRPIVAEPVGASVTSEMAAASKVELVSQYLNGWAVRSEGLKLLALAVLVRSYDTWSCIKMFTIANLRAAETEYSQHRQ